VGPSAALIWAACRPEPDPADVAAAVAAGADVGVVADEAIAQRVAPLLWRALDAAGCVDDTAAWADQLRADTMRCRAHAVLVLPRLADALLRPLADAGLEPLVMKGAILADRYPAPGLRPMDDVDVLLPPEQHTDALRVLTKAGWDRVARIPGTHHETVLTHPELPGTPLELHHDLATWQQRASRVTSDELWGARQPCLVQGAPAFGLEPELELVSVAAHAAKPFHVFGRLIWIVDLVVIVAHAQAAGRPVDWNRIEELADRLACRTALAVALQQAARLGLDSPESARRPLASGARLAALGPVLSPEWPVANHDWPTRHRLGYALADDSRQRVTLFLGAVTRGGVVRAPWLALATGGRAIRRWWQLRRSGPGERPGDREDVGQSVQP
jgi:hypothetical protein